LIVLTATKSTTVGRPEIAASWNPIDFAGDSSREGVPDHLVLGQGIGRTENRRGPVFRSCRVFDHAGHFDPGDFRPSKVIGIGKTVFHLVGLSGAGRVVVRRKILTHAVAALHG
jgi:hypothetical protein